MRNISHLLGKSDKLMPGNNWRYFYLKTFSCIVAIRAWLKIKIFDIRISNCAQVSIIFSTFLVQLVFLHAIIFHFSYFYYKSFSLLQQRWHRESRCYVHVKCRSNPKDCRFERWCIGAADAVMVVALAVTYSNPDHDFCIAQVYAIVWEWFFVSS